MTTRNSMGLRNFLLGQGCEARALQGGVIELRSGPQPTSPNNADSGTLLGIVTLDGNAHTPETTATGSVQLTGGTSGSVSSITVNGIEILGATIAFTTSLANTASLIAAQINRYLTRTGVEYTAVSDGTATPTITITPIIGVGASANGWAVVSTATTITKSDSNMAGGVSAVNGLSFDVASSASLGKNISETWSGAWLASGTIGHFRIKSCVADSGAASQALVRVDGSVTKKGGGGDLEITDTAVDIGAPFTVTSFALTQAEA